MHTDPKLKKRHVTALRSDDYMEPLLNAFAEASGLEKSAWVRAVVVRYLEENGCILPCERRVHLKAPSAA